jgi:hypothetical protein
MEDFNLERLLEELLACLVASNFEIEPYLYLVENRPFPLES